MEITYGLRVVAILAALVGATLSLRGAWINKRYRPWLLFRSLIFIYFAGVYTMALTGWGLSLYALRSGFLSSMGVVVLLLEHLACIMAQDFSRVR